MATATTTLRNRIIDTAIRAGKFPPSRRPHYEALWAKNPTEACITIAALATATPVRPSAAARSERGVGIAAAAGGGHVRVAASSRAPAVDDSYPAGWLSQTERAWIDAAERGEPRPEITFVS